MHQEPGCEETNLQNTAKHQNMEGLYYKTAIQQNHAISQLLGYKIIIYTLDSSRGWKHFVT